MLYEETWGQYSDNMILVPKRHTYLLVTNLSWRELSLLHNFAGFRRFEMILMVIRIGREYVDEV